MDKRVVIAGFTLLAISVVIWILNLQMGLGWHYSGETIYTADAVLSVSLPFFGILLVYLGILPDQVSKVH